MTFALDRLTGCGAPPMHPRKYEQARMLDRQGKKTERMAAVREARQASVRPRHQSLSARSRFLTRSRLRAVSRPRRSSPDRSRPLRRRAANGDAVVLRLESPSHPRTVEEVFRLRGLTSANSGAARGQGNAGPQEHHGGEEAVIFPPSRPMVVGTYPQRGVALPDGRQDEILVSSSCRRAPKALPIVVPTRMSSRFC